MEDKEIVIVSLIVIILAIILGIALVISDYNEIKSDKILDEYCMMKHGENYTYDVDSRRYEMICVDLETEDTQITQNNYGRLVRTE